MSGGCYYIYISVEQILASAKLRRMKLYTNLNIDNVPTHTSDNCCNSEYTDYELIIMDNSFMAISSDLSEEENASIFYICGYVAFKEKMERNTVVIDLDDASEFTRLVSRGKLTIPPNNLVRFAICCYIFFKETKIPCVNRLS